MSLGTITDGKLRDTGWYVPMDDADEHASISEWLAYHRSIGVGHFHIYDDNSQPPMQVLCLSECNLMHASCGKGGWFPGGSRRCLPCCLSRNARDAVAS